MCARIENITISAEYFAFKLTLFNYIIENINSCIPKFLFFRYKRIFSVGTKGITTYNPQTLEVTNQVQI